MFNVTTYLCHKTSLLFWKWVKYKESNNWSRHIGHHCITALIVLVARVPCQSPMSTSVCLCLATQDQVYTVYCVQHRTHYYTVCRFRFHFIDVSSILFHILVTETSMILPMISLVSSPKPQIEVRLSHIVIHFVSSQCPCFSWGLMSYKNCWLFTVDCCFTNINANLLTDFEKCLVPVPWTFVPGTILAHTHLNQSQIAHRLASLVLLLLLSSTRHN